MTIHTFKFILLFAAIVLSGISTAQDSPFRAGLLANFNGVQLNGETEEFWNQENGRIWGTGAYSFGASLMYNTRSQLDYGFEIRYIKKGSVLDFTNQFHQKDFEVLQLSYLEVPVFIDFNQVLKRGALHFQTGLSYAHLIHAQTAYSTTTQRTNSIDISRFKELNISWQGSLKYRLHKHQNWLLGLRFSHSILSIHEVYKLRNMVYGMEAEYRFQL